MLTTTSATFLILARLRCASAASRCASAARLTASSRSCSAVSRAAWAAGDRLKLLPLLAQSRLRLLFARADEVELQGCGLGRTLRPTRRPSLRRVDVVARQQAVRRPAARVPLDCALKVAGMLTQPIEVGVESGDQVRKAGAEARTRDLGLLIEKDVVELSQSRWRAHAF